MAASKAGVVVAGTVAVGTVSLAALAVEQSSTPPPFSPTADRFPLHNFQGRFSKLLSQCNPMLLTKSTAEIQAARALVESGQGTDSELWAARQLKESAVHPDTGDVIPQPCRMTGYMPYNGPVCVCMIFSKTPTMQLFWNWVNQSQNALVNYCNRNAASETSAATMGISYGCAVGSALSVVYGLTTILRRANKAHLMKYVAFPASVVASSGNCFIMRRPELSTGIPVLDADGRQLGISHVAAQHAVGQTVLSRVLLQVPVFLVPPVLMSLPPIAALSPGASLSFSTYVGLVCFGIGLPATLAIFPEIGTVNAADCEPELRGLQGCIAGALTDEKPATGELQTLYFRRGL